jgi:hypothetical protein
VRILESDFSFLFFWFLSSEDQVVSTTRQDVDERQPSKSFAQILLLVFCLFDLVNSNKCDDVSMCFWHLPLVLWHYNKNTLVKFVGANKVRRFSFWGS